MLTLIEKAEKSFDEERAKQLGEKMRRATFDLEDFLGQLQEMKKMGPLDQIVDMIPGLSSLARKMPEAIDEGKLKKIEAMILSMTPQERHNPEIIDGRRKRRIARGSGTTSQDVNQLLNMFRQTQKLMKHMARGKGLGLLGSMFR